MKESQKNLISTSSESFNVANEIIEEVLAKFKKTLLLRKAEQMKGIYAIK